MLFHHKRRCSPRQVSGDEILMNGVGLIFVLIWSPLVDPSFHTQAKLDFVKDIRWKGGEPLFRARKLAFKVLNFRVGRRRSGQRWRPWRQRTRYHSRPFI